MSPSPPRTALTLANAVQASTKARILAEFERINNAFKQDGRIGQGSYPLRQAALARQVLYLAQSIGDAERQGQTARLDPRWTKVIERYNRFREDVSTLDFLPSVISENDLDGLCRHSTRRRGSGTKLFYSAMALFVIDQSETGLMDTDFIRFAMPQCETSFAAEMRNHVLQAIEGGDAHKIEKRHEYPIINVGYTFQPDLFDRFTGFFEHFASEVDGCAHFICYRPGHTSPHELVKSFLAIVPPSRRKKDSYGFVHIYRMPRLGDQHRISLGEVLPLAGSLYLVGGQRPRQEKKEKTLPFNTLKVVELPWQPIEAREKIFGGLVMSSNYEGKPLVSRLAIRATPTAHHSDTLIGGINLTELSKDLASDISLESQKFAEADLRGEIFAVQPDSGAARITELCNNNPTNWNAPHGYFALNNDGTIGRRVLTKAIVETQLADAFGSDENPLFKNPDPTADDFSFWRSLHFGPITTK